MTSGGTKVQTIMPSEPPGSKRKVVEDPNLSGLSSKKPRKEVSIRIQTIHVRMLILNGLCNSPNLRLDEASLTCVARPCRNADPCLQSTANEYKAGSSLSEKPLLSLPLNHLRPRPPPSLHPPSPPNPTLHPKQNPVPTLARPLPTLLLLSRNIGPTILLSLLLNPLTSFQTTYPPTRSLRAGHAHLPRLCMTNTLLQLLGMEMPTQTSLR